MLNDMNRNTSPSTNPVIKGLSAVPDAFVLHEGILAQGCGGTMSGHGELAPSKNSPKLELNCEDYKTPLKDLQSLKT